MIDKKKIGYIIILNKTQTIHIFLNIIIGEELELEKRFAGLSFRFLIVDKTLLQGRGNFVIRESLLFDVSLPLSAGLINNFSENGLEQSLLNLEQPVSDILSQITTINKSIQQRLPFSIHCKLNES